MAPEDVSGPRLAPSAPPLAETVAAREAEDTERRRLHDEAARLRARADGEAARHRASALLEDAWNFLMAGGVVSRADWLVMSSEQRWSLTRAGESLERERALLVAAALRPTPPEDPLVAAGRAAISEAAGRTT